MKIGIGPKRALMIAVFLLFLGTQVSAEDPFFPLSALKPGMKGQGFTVFSGTEVEAFPVEIVGLMEGSGTLSHLVLVKLTGGQTVAAGMSGSPVFIGGKLVGAIGYGFQNADARFAVVTPIEAMLSMWEREADETFILEQGDLLGYQGVVLGGVPPEGSWLQARPVATPLFLSGYGPRAGNYLLTTLQGQGAFVSPQGRTTNYPGLIPALYPLAVAGEENRPALAHPPLQPGSALTLTLVEGDYKVTALGTLTWQEEDKILGFGHPFLNKGWVEYGVGSATILGVIDSNHFPFKLGVASPTIGRILQDRGAGVAGEIGVLPRMVPVSTEVTDETTGLVRNYTFAVVNDEDLLPGLVLAGVMDTIDRTIDRIGPGTASVYFEVNGANFSSFQRENLFYGQDIAMATLQEFGEMLRVIIENEFVQPELTGIKLRIKVNSERRHARINKVELPKKEFAPGEKVTLTVDLLPFRGEAVQTPLEVELPTTPGKWLLMVYGNQYGFTAEDQGSSNEEHFPPELYPTYKSLEEKLADYRRRPQNNQLVVEFVPTEGGPERPEGLKGPGVSAEESLEDEREDPEGPEVPVDWDNQTVTTSYFVTGEEQIIVEVVAPATIETPELFWAEYDGEF